MKTLEQIRDRRPEQATKFESLTETSRDTLKTDQPKYYRELYQSWIGQKGIDDFWYFLRNVLQNPVLYEPLHRPLAEWLQPGEWKKQKKLLLLPRGHVKSNILTVGYCVWRMVKDPNIRILLASHKEDDAEKFLETIQKYIDENEWFKTIYPEIVPAMGRRGQPRCWNKKQALLARTSTATEPTVQCTSPNANVTGRHYMLLVNDDLVTDSSTKHAELIEKTANFHKLCESLLDPGALELTLGTRYHFEDEYGRIIDSKELQGIYDIRQMSATKTLGIVNHYIANNDEWTREVDFDELIFPSRFTLDIRDHVDPDGIESKNRKSLPLTRLMQGSAVYANQYDLQPMDPKEAVFQEEDIRVVEYLPHLPMKRYQFCDLASEKLTQSRTAIVTVSVSEYFDIYIEDVYWGNYNQRQIAEELVSWQLIEDPALRPVRVGIENGPYEIQFKSYIRRRQKELGVLIPFKELTGAQHNLDKKDHIKSLLPFVEAQKVFIVSTCRNRAQIIDEFTKFPKTLQLDCIDALAQITKIVRPSTSKDFLARGIPAKPVEKKKGVTFDEVLKGMEVRPDAIGNHQVRRRSGMVRF